MAFPPDSFEGGIGRVEDANRQTAYEIRFRLDAHFIGRPRGVATS